MPPQSEATLERETAYVPTATSPAHGAMNGRRYVESLRMGREVWIDGELVRDVTAHPAFKSMIEALARVYDLQNSPKYRDEMTFVDPEFGRAHRRVMAVAAFRRRSQAQAPQQRTVERTDLGPARPQSRYPRPLHYFRAPPQG